MSFINQTPFKSLFISWISIIAIRELPVLTYPSISAKTYIYILLFILLTSLGIAIGNIRTNGGARYRHLRYYRKKDIKRSATIISTLSIVSSLLLIYKFYILNGTLLFTISDITTLRFERARDDDAEMGNMISGLIGYMLSGFFVVSIVYKEYFKEKLSYFDLNLLTTSFYLGLIVSLLSGGRWAAATAILTYAISKLILGNQSNSSTKKVKSSLIKKIFTAFAALIIIYIFLQFFLDRIAGEITEDVLFGVLENNLIGTSVPIWATDLFFNDIDSAKLYFYIAMIHYYVSHSLFQLDILLNAPYPTNAPYLLAYQGYLQTLFLNKIGFSIISINQILSEIPNPGVYFTLPGALYLDFTYFGSCIIFFLLGFLAGKSWTSYIRDKSIISFYFSVLFVIFFASSPIVAISSTGIFPSMISIVPILLIIFPKSYRSNQNA